MIPGNATPEGTARLRERFAARQPGHHREAHGLWLSSIGLGTYLGEPDAECDARYREAIARAVELGTNVLDTAVNYRHQRGERVIGEALRELIARHTLRRDEIFVATKGGFLSFDRDEPDDPAAYFEEKFLRTGLIESGDVAAGCHVMSPRYLENQIETSRRNLGLETLDLYYLHNPETQLRDFSREKFFARLRKAFEALEKAASENKIRAYGVATWNAFRAPQSSPEALALADVLRVAQEAGGAAHHFRAVQLPFNLAMPEALAAPTQALDGQPAPLLRVARARGLMVFASATLLQTQLTQGLPEDCLAWFPGLKTDAQRAIQFVRSTPGITAALVGMSRREHVEEDLGTAAVAPLSPNEFRAIFAK